MEPHHTRLPPCAGINIAGTGFQYWGGGVFCAENVKGLAPQQIACQVPVPPANTTFVTGECYAPAVSILWHLVRCSLPPVMSCSILKPSALASRCYMIDREQHGLSAVCVTLLGELMMCCASVRWLTRLRLHPQFVPMCSGNGNVQLPFGSPQYLGIGALVLLVWVFVEIFGSPFFRNIEVRLLSRLHSHTSNAHCGGPRTHHAWSSAVCSSSCISSVFVMALMFSLWLHMDFNILNNRVPLCRSWSLSSWPTSSPQRSPPAATAM